jgi:AIPR protein
LPDPDPEDRQYIEYINDRADRLAAKYGLSTGRAFMLWYAVDALELDENTAFEATSFDGGNDKNVDLFYVDDESERVVIGQGKYGSHGNKRPRPGDLYELVHTPDWLLHPEELEAQGRQDLADAGREYQEALSKGYTTVFLFVYMGPRKRELVEATSLLNNQSADQALSQSVRLVDSGGLRLVHEEAVGGASRIPRFEIRIDPQHVFEQRGTFGQALAVTISGSELRRMYEAHQEALFDRNVRLYLGERKGSVNAGIRETLNSSDRTNFWAYNNGLTIVCDSYQLDADGTITLRDFSIVNGCQTTVTVANSATGVAGQVEIPARIIASDDDAVVDSIIRFTNSQTPIRQWDITARDRTNRRLKQELAAMPHPFFYELRHGEARSLTTDAKRQYQRDGRFQLISYDQLAQYLAAFGGLPHVAYKDKARLFSMNRDQVFPHDLRVEYVTLIWLAAEEVEEAVRSAIKNAAERGFTGKVRILKRGGKIFSLAVMSVLLRERNGPNFSSRLNRQSVGSNANRSRLEPYATLAANWYVRAAESVLARSTDDMAKLVRSQEFFASVEAEVLSMWETQSLDRTWLNNALPAIGN